MCIRDSLYSESRNTFNNNCKCNTNVQPNKINSGDISLTNCATIANLFDNVQRPTTFRGILGIISSPRFVRVRGFLRVEGEESEVAVGHVLILGAEQTPPHDWELRMTEHDHCGTQHVISVR